MSGKKPVDNEYISGEGRRMGGSEESIRAKAVIGAALAPRERTTSAAARTAECNWVFEY